MLTKAVFLRPRRRMSLHRVSVRLRRASVAELVEAAGL
jgi:hypothetical protein